VQFVGHRGDGRHGDGRYVSHGVDGAQFRDLGERNDGRLLSRAVAFASLVRI
jgi:hypothetical protein